jgi:hypothetical protein
MKPSPDQRISWLFERRRTPYPPCGQLNGRPPERRDRSSHLSLLLALYPTPTTSPPGCPGMGTRGAYKDVDHERKRVRLAAGRPRQAGRRVWSKPGAGSGDGPTRNPGYPSEPRAVTNQAEGRKVLYGSLTGFARATTRHFRIPRAARHAPAEQLLSGFGIGSIIALTPGSHARGIFRDGITREAVISDQRSGM